MPYANVFAAWPNITCAPMREPHRPASAAARTVREIGARERRVVAAAAGACASRGPGARRASCAITAACLHSLWAIFAPYVPLLGALLEWVLKSGLPADDPQRMWALKTALAEIEKACARLHVCVASAGVPCTSEYLY
jgi:hypothetical protein